jgi:hypothetical protein
MALPLPPICPTHRAFREGRRSILENGAGNLSNVNDVNNSVSDYMNRSMGFRTLQSVFLNYQPIADRGTIVAPTDPRTNGTKRLYSAQQWGKNAIYINTDSRSYRDIRIKTANAGADDTTSPRADNMGRTYLGATQLAWLEQTLLDAQNAGTPWKFVSVSDPIDQLGPQRDGLLLGAEKKARLHQKRSGLQSSTKLQSSQANSGCMRPELGRVLQ